MFDNNKIDKPTIVITSLGRTGTKYFQVIFREIFPEFTVLHEPDVLNYFQYRGFRERVHQLKIQVRESGFGNLFILKPLGLWSLISVSDSRFRGKCTEDQAVKRILRQRKSFILAQAGSAYIESNIAFYGILDLLEQVFVNYRGVFLIRDGRDWVRSHMNWGQMYGKGYLQRLFAHRWPTASELKLMSRQDWNELTRFEKLCWAWGNLNKYALDRASGIPELKVVRFEDIFISPDKYAVFSDLMSHLSIITGSAQKNNLSGLLERQVHQSTGSFPKWELWSEQQREIFLHHCEDLSLQLDYDLESDPADPLGNKT